jgi:membrane protease YdiL (CAAX protease family)
VHDAILDLCLNRKFLPDLFCFVFFLPKRWEEVLYRGFLLPALHLFFPLPFALPLSGLLFGLHHQAIASVLPLAALGSFWALLYVLSRNLAVPVLIHALWNSRVFLGSLLGV